MTVTDHITELDAELDSRKEAVRDDLAQIREKLKETREQLSPVEFVRRNALLLCGAGLIAGFALGYWGVAFADIAKPVAQSALSTAGKRAVTRMI